MTNLCTFSLNGTVLVGEVLIYVSMSRHHKEIENRLFDWEAFHMTSISSQTSESSRRGAWRFLGLKVHHSLQEVDKDIASTTTLSTERKSRPTLT